MRTIILATDESPRLKPLTDTLPGALIPVVNRPAISIMLELLARAGCKHALVSLFNRGGSIASLLSTGSRWGMSLDYLAQREALGTAGALRWAGHLLKETFLVLPGDAIVDLDIADALAFHRAHGGPATIIAGRRAGSTSTALSTIGNRVTGLSDATPDAGLQATGAFLFEASVLEHIPAHTPFDCLTNLIPVLLATGSEVHAYEMCGYWNPLHSFEEYCEAQRTFLLNAFHVNQPEVLDTLGVARLRYPSVEGRQIAPGIWVGRNDVIHPTAQFAPPVCIGDNCWIGREAEIGPEVVIGANAVVDEEATAERSTVLERTYVGRLLKLSNVVANRSTLIDSTTGHSTEVVDSFLLSEIGAEAEGGAARWLSNMLGATALCILLFPFMLLLGLFALLTSGRLLTREQRVGSRPPTLRARQETGPYRFEMLRFATQRANGTTTAYGRWLLRTELAYLPALLNVLRGECELVGVTPLWPEEAERIHEAWQQKHFDRPAGLCGAWYVQAPRQRDLDALLVIDAYYVSMRTWHGDILLLWQSAAAWARKRVRSATKADKPVLVSDVS